MEGNSKLLNELWVPTRFGKEGLRESVEGLIPKLTGLEIPISPRR
jgi:hypothetical protein